ncbi:MAG: hypothetical protein D4R65_11240 [Verrucomicrobiaceae bacterium]|nr:MAG: hypothetical protein D4R65_11240 [Verrucomicrobiaceae bacterium]
MKRIGFLDYAKGVLITLVVVGHTIQYVFHPHGDFLSDPLFKLIYIFHMPLFIGISGYLCHAGIQRLALQPYILSKLKAYLIPIFSWAALYECCVFGIGGNMPLIDLPVSIINQAVSSLWFLWVLMGCLFLTAAVKAVGHWFRLIYLSAFLLTLLLPEQGNVIMLKYMLPFFQAGYLFAAIPVNVSNLNTKAILAAAAGVLIICYVLWSKDTYVYVSGNQLTSAGIGHLILRYTAGFAASVTVIITLFYLYLKSSARLRNAIEILGGDSIYIYIIQSYVFGDITRITWNLSHPVSNPFLNSLLAVLCGAALTYVCWLTGKILSATDIGSRIFFGKSKWSPSTWCRAQL